MATIKTNEAGIKSCVAQAVGRTQQRFVLWRINRLCEKCAGLKAKIDFWESLKSVDTGGLPGWRCEQIGEWREQLSAMLLRKARLEGADMKCCGPQNPSFQGTANL